MALALRRPALLVVAVLLAGCGGGTAEETGAGAAGFPITFDNCGREVTIERPPERVLTIGTGAVTLLELAGAADTIVGRAGEFGNPPDGAAGEAVADVPVIAEETPALEAIIGAEPDLVVSYGLFDLTAEDLAGAGITSMVLSGYCGNDGTSDVGDGQRFDDLTSDLELFGRIFGTEDKATAAAEKLNERVEAVRKQAVSRDGQTAVAFYFLGGQGPYVFGDASITTAQMEVFGLTNAFPDVQLQADALNLEEFIAADPDVLIQIYGYDEGETFQDAREVLLALPGVADMQAVVDNQIVGLQGPRAEPSAAAVDGLEELTQGFIELR